MTGQDTGARAPCLAEGARAARRAAAESARAAGASSKEGLVPRDQAPQAGDAGMLCGRELGVVTSQMTAVLPGLAAAQEKYYKVCLEMSTVK